MRLSSWLRCCWPSPTNRDTRPDSCSNSSPEPLVASSSVAAWPNSSPTVKRNACTARARAAISARKRPLTSLSSLELNSRLRVRSSRSRSDCSYVASTRSRKLPKFSSRLTTAGSSPARDAARRAASNKAGNSPSSARPSVRLSWRCNPRCMKLNLACAVSVRPAR